MDMDPFDSFHVTLFVTPDKHIEEFPLSDIVYPAQVIKFGGWYDAVAGHSKLVAFLDSPMMVQRFNGLAQILGTAPGYQYQPHMTVMHHLPPLSSSIKSFIASVANTLVSKEEIPFMFQGELCLNSEQMHISTPDPDDIFLM